MKRNPLITKEQAIRAHERFFTEVVPNIHHFTVEEISLSHNSVCLRMVWKNYKPSSVRWRDTVITSKDYLVPAKEDNFIHLIYHV